MRFRRILIWFALPMPAPANRRLSSNTPPHKKEPPYGGSFFGGRGWIRTTEVSDGRFTVCSLWPLGNSSLLSFGVSSLHRNGAGERTLRLRSKSPPEISPKFPQAAHSTQNLEQRFSPFDRYPYTSSGAGERTRTPDLLITNQLLYQLSYTSISQCLNNISHLFAIVKRFFSFFL